MGFFVAFGTAWIALAGVNYIVGSKPVYAHLVSPAEREPDTQTPFRTAHMSFCDMGEVRKGDFCADRRSPLPYQRTKTTDPKRVVRQPLFCMEDTEESVCITESDATNLLLRRAILEALSAQH